MKRVSAGVGADRLGRVRALGKRAASVVAEATESGEPRLLADRLSPDQRERLRQEFDGLLARAAERGFKPVQFVVVVKEEGVERRVNVPVEG